MHKQRSAWDITIADGIFTYEKSREGAEASLEKWRAMLERRGMRISRAKTEYLCLNGGEGTIKLQDIELLTTKDLM